MKKPNFYDFVRSQKGLLSDMAYPYIDSISYNWGFQRMSRGAGSRTFTREQFLNDMNKQLSTSYTLDDFTW